MNEIKSSCPLCQKSDAHALYASSLCPQHQRLVNRRFCVRLARQGLWRHLWSFLREEVFR